MNAKGDIIDEIIGSDEPLGLDGWIALAVIVAVTAICAVAK